MTTFKGSLGYSSQTKRDKFISQYTDVQNDEMVKIFMGNKRGCLLQPLPVSIYTSVCVQSSQALQLSRPRPFYANGVTGQCGGEGLERGAGVSIKNPPPSPPPSLRCCGEEGSNYSGVSVAGCDSSPGKRRRASITHRPAMG